MSFKIEPLIIDENNITSIIYNFSTSGLIDNNYSFIFETKEPIKYICNIIDYEENILGYPEYYEIIKDFRYLKNNLYTEWLSLNIENLQNIDCLENYTIQIRYSIYYNEKDYNRIIPFSLSNGIVYSDNSIYTFEEDFPFNGYFKYYLKYSTDNCLHYNYNTDMFVLKTNSVWSSPFTITYSDKYYPSIKNGLEINSELISNATTAGFYPINDYLLNINTDITFTSKNNYPKRNDNIYINLLYQDITLNMDEYLEIKYFPVEIENPYIILDSFKLKANTYYPTKKLLDISPNEYLSYKVEDILKVYNICGFCISTNFNNYEDYLDVKFRYSFNSRRWESDWIKLSDETLSCIRGSAIKFFYIEFLFHNISDKIVNIFDIQLIGDFQNISKDSTNIKRFGINSDCLTENEYLDESNSCTLQPPSDWDVNNLCYKEPSFKPYDMNLSIALYEKLANDVSTIFAWEIDYYRVEPDETGTDHLLHEYQTLTKVAESKVKVLVPENNFPEERVEFNMFDLAMFDSFEIHITKKEFYSKFGIGIRPAKDDYLFFCQINKWFKVEHAHSVRNFNNASVYYKLILVKKQDDKNINNKTNSMFETSTLNNSLENLFGEAVRNNINKATCILQDDLTEQYAKDYQESYSENIEVEDTKVLNISKPDPIKYAMYANIIDEELINATTIICKSYYDLNNRTDKIAIQYGYKDNIDICTKRGISMWFNIHTYKSGQVYNLLNNFNYTTSEGYRIDFIDGMIEVIYFDQTFEFDVKVSPNKWYGLVLNIDYISSNINLSLHRRVKDGLSNNTKLDIINEYTKSIVTKTGNSNINMNILGSPMYWANLRVFDDIIDNKDVILNQFIVRNNDHLIVGDNNDGFIISPEHKF